MFRWRNFVLLALPLIALIPLLVWGSVTLYQQSLQDVVSESDEQTARTVASAITTQLERRAEIVRGIAEQAAISDDYELLLANVGFLDDAFALGIVIFDLSGNPLAVRNVLRDDVIDWPFPRSTASPFSLIELNAQSGQPQMRVVATNESVQVVGGFNPVQLAEQALADVAGEGTANVTTILDQSNMPIIGTLITDPALNITIPPVNWTLTIPQSIQPAGNPRLIVLLLSPLFLIPVLLIALGAIWFGDRQILRPLQQLEQQAAALGQGQFDSIEQEVGGIEAVQRLQSELVQMAARVERAQSNLRTQVGAITHGQEEERRRLARELHDDTIQSLIALNQRVQLTQLRANGNEQLGSDLLSLQKMIEALIGDVRRFMHALRPVGLEDLGLIPALELLIENTGQLATSDLDFTTIGDPRRLAISNEFALYRIAQEALNNAVQHANAEQILLSLHFAADAIILSVTDDGDGFTVPASLAEMATIGQFGLLGIHERAELIGAEVEILSGKDGTTVRVVLSERLSVNSYQ